MINEGSHNAENDSNYNGTAGIFQSMFRHAIKIPALPCFSWRVQKALNKKLNKPYLVYANRDVDHLHSQGIYDVGTPIN
jgi:hypothetical protein